MRFSETQLFAMMLSAMAAIVGRLTSAINPTWPILIPRSGTLRFNVISAARKIVPSPPRTTAISISGKSAGATFLMPSIETSEIV